MRFAVLALALSTVLAASCNDDNSDERGETPAPPQTAPADGRGDPGQSGRDTGGGGKGDGEGEGEGEGGQSGRDNGRKADGEKGGAERDTGETPGATGGLALAIPLRSSPNGIQPATVPVQPNTGVTLVLSSGDKRTYRARFGDREVTVRPGGQAKLPLPPLGKNESATVVVRPGGTLLIEATAVPPPS